jgi:hypothetical protein
MGVEALGNPYNADSDFIPRTVMLKKENQMVRAPDHHIFSTLLTCSPRISALGLSYICL